MRGDNVRTSAPRRSRQPSPRPHGAPRLERPGPRSWQRQQARDLAGRATEAKRRPGNLDAVAGQARNDNPATFQKATTTFRTLVRVSAGPRTTGTAFHVTGPPGDRPEPGDVGTPSRLLRGWAVSVSL